MSAKQPRQSGPRQGGRQQQQQPQQQQAQPQQAQAAAANGASAAAAAAPAAKQQADGLSPTAAATNGAVLNDETRLLVDWHHVGAIIGKGGASVKSIREESGCAINIIAPSPSAPSPQQIDRIMSIRGTVEQTTKAIFLIAHTIQARAAERKAAGQEDSRAAHRGARDLADGTTAIKLLVHRAAVGAVIGKGGDSIRQTQAETGARIQVSSEPLGGSTDKSVTISGTPEVVESAVHKVLSQLAESPLRAGTKTVHFVPGPAFYDYDANGQQQPAPHMAGHPHPQHPHPHPHVAQIGTSGAGLVAGGGPISIQKIAIPTICAGCVIGRNGVIISNLREQSGTNISIADPEPATPDERVVTITGSPQGISTAVYLIKSLVESYVPREQQTQEEQQQATPNEQQQQSSPQASEEQPSEEQAAAAQ